MRKITCAMLLLVLLFAVVLVTMLLRETAQVKEINMTPAKYYGSKMGSILPPEKLGKEYRYVFIQSDSDINPKKYHSEHPEDAVEEKCLGKINCVLYIFSDQMRPEFNKK